MQTIDCYGHRNIDSERFRKTEEKWIEVAEDSTGNVYFRFSTADAGPIHRISTDENGNTVRLWAFGNWSERETLTYDAGLAEAKTIEAGE